jgi:hypothetical protein
MRRTLLEYLDPHNPRLDGARIRLNRERPELSDAYERVWIGRESMRLAADRHGIGIRRMQQRCAEARQLVYLWSRPEPPAYV